MSVKLSNVGFSFDSSSVLAGVDLVVDSSDLVIVQGRNGSGKTTLLNLIAGLYPPDLGEVWYSSDLLVRKGKINRNVLSYMPARFAGPTHISGQKYLEAIAGMRGMELGVMRDNIEKYGTGLLSKDEFRKEIRNYSTGMIRKIHFLSTIISEPLLLLLDEPFDNVDTDAKKCMMHYMTLLQDQGSAIICVTHGFHSGDFRNYRLYTLEHKKLVCVL